MNLIKTSLDALILWCIQLHKIDFEPAKKCHGCAKKYSGWTQMQTPKADQVQTSDLFNEGKHTCRKAGEGRNQESVKFQWKKKKQIQKT